MQITSGPALALVLTLGLSASASAAPLTVYDDVLRNGFADWSWGVRNLASTSPVHGGSAAISFEPDGWTGLFFHRDLGLELATYEAVEFWVRGSGTGGQLMTFAVTAGGTPLGQAHALGEFIPGGVLTTSWTFVRVPFASLGVTSGNPDGFWFQDATGGNQGTIYVDDVRLAERTTQLPPPAAISVSINLDADRHPVSPQIFGVSFGDDGQAGRRHWPIRRWGGNATTRYSWQDDTANRAFDYLFMNIPEANSNPGALPNGSAVDHFLDVTRAAGGEPILTVPTIGWTPKDRAVRWGFSVAKYGAQQQTECTINPFPGCNADAGNGVKPNGTNVTGNDPHDTSREVGPSFVTAWMTHLAARYGTAAQGGIRLFALDNEPALWNSSHRDVHPNPLTYDELWQKSRDTAAAIKAQDPNAQVLGPVSWGWCEYFYSAADGCSPGPDMQAHGGLALTDWYLKQVADYRTATGVRLVDQLDVHYYPQGTNIALSDDESASTSARRLRSLRGLYDPSYVDESWIGQPVSLIPRMKAWIAGRLPGTKLALTEWNWGNDDGLSSALAHAEALAIFGREGVDLAARWVAPAEGSRVEDAFKLYLDYDGAGSKVTGDSVRATSSEIDGVGSYAIRSVDGKLFLLLFNKDTVVRHVDSSLVSGTYTGSATLYRFDGSRRLGSLGTANPSGAALSLDLPARSATLAVLRLTGGAPAPGFYALSPCRVIDTRNPTGPYGGPALGSGDRTFTLTGRCGIPAGAKAVALNLSVTQPTAAGALRLFPTGIALPGTTAINFGTGQTRTNNAILGLDANGNLTVHADLAAGASVQMILDVNGYFQ
ncbi:MAG TPA: glycoside hydrolase family 44 protein [Thermoanaerobaculia bacterium]|nr:glycoside hydrolase family 44 protein [Thermoanaerobaculia bacterium]